MNKLGLFGFIWLIILLVAGFFLFWWLNYSGNDGSCNFDIDCVPATCCHADSCVVRSEEPNCTGVACTEECRGDTLDCGHGSCKCVDKQCEAVMDG